MKKPILIIVLIGVFAIYLMSRDGHRRPDPETASAPLIGSSRLAELLSDAAALGFPQAIEPRAFRFPADHGAHPDFRNEWWYVTGNLDAATGERLGFELTLFRFSLTPAAVASRSAWRSNQVYVGHFAITDAANEEFYVADRYSRGSLGLAGASAEPFRVWLQDWQIAAEGGPEPNSDAAQWRLQAMDDEIAIDLSLVPLKAPVLNGVDGLSQKSERPGNASYYYSMTRMQTEGSVQIGDRTFDVSGLSWLDREWGSSALSSDQSGWDWFALQFDDDSELMFYNIRRLDGTQDGLSAGTFVASDGRTIQLTRDDVLLEVLDYWQSPLGGRYPSGWRVSVPSLEMSLEIEPVLDAQELLTNVRYWEGAVDVTARSSGKVVRGRGYVELTGYAEQPGLAAERND